MKMSKPEDKDKSQNIPTQLANIVGNPEKMIPKFCTSIGISLLKNKNIALTMVYHEEPSNIGNVIDSIMIDLDHAKSIKIINQP